MATREQIYAALKAADAAGNVVDATALARAYQNFASAPDSSLEEAPVPEAPPKRPGFTGAYSNALTTLGLTDELAAYKADPTDANRKKLLDTAHGVDPATGKPKYQGVGFGEGENWEAFKEMLGGSLGQMTAPLAAGYAASLPFGAAAAAETATVAGAPLAIPTLGAGLIAGTTAAIGTGGAQYTIQNAVRQAEEQQKAIEEGKKPEELSLTKAAVAAAPQAVLDQAELFVFGPLARALPMVKSLVTPAGKATESAISKIIEAAQKGTLKTVAGGVTKGIAEGVAFEVPTEIAQQALERWQAGLSLTDDDAVGEYKQAAIGAALLGPVFGGPSGALGALNTRTEAREALTGKKSDKGEDFDEGETPPPPPGAAPSTPAGFDINTATEDEARTNLTSDPKAIEDFNRYRTMGFSVPKAFDYAYRESLDRNPAPKTTAEKSGGPKQDDQGTARDAGADGPEPSVLAPSGEDVDGRTAGTTTGATRAGLDVSGGAAQQTRGRKNGEPGTLEEDGIGAREEARIKYDEDAERLENELRSLSSLPEKENDETDEAYQNRVWEEESRRRDMGAKSEAGAGPSLFDINANPESKEVPRSTFAPAGTGGLPLFTEERNTTGATPLRTDEVLQPTESRLIKAGTPEAEEILRRERPAPREEVPGQTEEDKAADVARERMDNVADYFEGWVGRNPSFAPIRGMVKPYLRAAARAVVEDNVEPTDALLKAIPEKYKVQRAAVRNSFPSGTADAIIPSVPRVPQAMQGPKEVLVDRKLAEAIRFINAYVKNVNAPEIQKEWEAELEKAGIDFTKSEAPIQGSLLPKDTVASFLSRIKEYERARGVEKPAPRAKAAERAPTLFDTPQKTQEEPAASTEEGALLTAEQRERGEYVADKFGGPVVYQDGDLGLVRGYDARSGQPNYIPFKGNKHLYIDVDGDTTALRLSAEEKAQLSAEKARLEAEDAKKQAETPFVTFDKGGVAVSEGVNKQLAGVISGWKKILLPGVKLYVTTEEDAAKNKNNFTGKLRAVGSVTLRKNRQGSASYVGDNTYYIMFKKGTKPTLNLETIAHEMGHVHEIEVLTRTPSKTRTALEAAHFQWLGQQKGKTARELVDALRGRAMGPGVTLTDKNLTAAQLEPYWRSFSEWYADQTARWAVSNEKPVSVVDQFFARLGRALRKFYNTLRGQGYLPNETFAQYMNSVAGSVNLSSVDIARSAGPLFEAKSEAGKAEEGISRGQAQYEQGKNAAEQTSGIELAIEARDPGALNDVAHRAGQNLTKALTKILPTSAMTDIMGYMDKQAGVAAQRVIKEADAASDTKANLSSGLFNLVKPVVKFVNKHGYGVLANMQSTARLYKHDPFLYENAQESVKNDHYIKGYDNLIASATTPSERADYIAGRAKRAAEITETHKVKDELAKLPGGLEAYNILRQFYRDAHNIRRAARDKLFDVMSAGDPAARARFDKIRTDFFEKIRTAPDPNYHNIERSPVQLEEYSPFMRFGDYYLRVTKGVNGEPEYYHFDDATVRRRFLQRRASELGVSATDADMFQTGKLDTQKGRMEFLNSDAALRAMFDLIDSNPRLSPEQKESLKDDAYQARLDALPESDLRQHFKHAKERTGWAPDPLRVYNSYATKFINDITKIQHEQKFNAEVTQARDLLKSMPLGDAKDKLEEYMEAVIGQAKSGFSPPNTNALATFMNRAGFLYFLSGGATAMAQFVSVPGRVVPAVGSVYGYDKAGKLFGKYTKVAWGGKSLRTTLPDGTKEWSYPGLDKSKEIKNNPRLLNAFKTLEEMRVYSLTPTAAIVGLEDTPTTALNAVDHKVKSTILQVSTALFNTTETLSRQMSAMMFYEAAYDARIAKGVDSKQAHVEAIAEAATGTERALGNYRETERPSIMKGPLGRMVFQFKMYSVNTTKFFLENIYLMTRDLDPEVQRRAKSELVGVVAIGGLFSGATGVFGYSVISTAIGMLLSQLEDDEDKRRRIEEDPIFADDYDGYFRYRWLPAHFGKLGASIVEVGPLAALTPLNLASRTSYNDLWLREGLTGGNWSENAKNLILANIGPAVTMGGSLDLAAKDFNDGEVMRGIERMMPAVVRGPLMSYRLATEGAETRKGDKIVSPEEISTGELVGAALGLSPRVVADYQKKRIKALNFQAQLRSNRADILRAINKAAFDNDNDAMQRAMQKKNEFEARYPSLYLIDDDTLDKSFDAYEKVREKTIRGVPVEDDELPYYNFLIDGGAL
ncbi:hypothetical protein UFOVP1193_49 [uncultured Caudovirales phage]|uniref:Large polyvalent protein associated domain-containing protein n=1 Tax=uncultured Caudovirales phage TaxID=2100421 RepID=A0A6J5RF71_9CAUD|nr:hypothetical protein UFOVP1193_49 [uncultured Caudovirales phage]